MKNYYEILGITNNTTENDIYCAYKNKIAQFNHLPFHTSKMIYEIKSLKEALYVLSDKNKRIKYDNKLEKMTCFYEEGKTINNTKICDRLFSIKFQ
jgi:DnaJ-class molecular chaperone